MTLDDITVPWRHLNNPDGLGAFSGESSDKTEKRTMTFAVAFEDYESFIRQVRGTPQLFGSGSTALVEPSDRLVFPYNPSLFADRVSLRGIGLDSAVDSDRPYTYVAVTVEFTSVPWDTGPVFGPRYSVVPKGSSSVITIPGTGYTFSSGEYIDQDLGRMVGTLTFEITRHQIPDFDWWLSVTMPLLGKVNSSALTIKGTTLAAGHVLFPTFEMPLDTQVQGGLTYQSTFPLLWRELAWNSGIRSDGVVDTITPVIYTTGNLGNLLS